MIFDPSIFPPTMRDGLCDADVIALRELAIKVSKENAIFVEVGSWKGHSTAVLGQIARECNGYVYCIDHWRGSPGVPAHNIDNAFQVFLSNMRIFGLTKYIKMLVMESVIAAKIFANEIADLVFIDADHRYSSVKQDIEAWYPKVKGGGILCGHDCEGYYLDYNEEHRSSIDNGLEQDTSLPGCHAGVVKALYDGFGNDFIMARNRFKSDSRELSTIWIKEKND